MTAKAPGEKYRQRHLVELGRRPVRGAVQIPVLVPAPIGTLARLQVTEGAKGGGAAARVEQRRRSATQVARPHEVVGVVAVVVGLPPRRGGRSDERSRVRLVFQTPQHGERCAGELSLVAADFGQCLWHRELRAPCSPEMQAGGGCATGKR